MHLFSVGRHPTPWDTRNSWSYMDLHKGTFLVSSTSAGLAVIVEDFGLTFPSSATTTTKRGYEVAPDWENDYVTWDTTKGGFIITFG